MKEVRYFYVPNAAIHTELPTEEATHAVRVLRLKDGDDIFLRAFFMKLLLHWQIKSIASMK